ncbi:MAG TPA: hypothetical protein VKD19_03535 [Pseudolabrys sp.]|nr:hypothetical protein [Pseudolabrys sp.]
MPKISAQGWDQKTPKDLFDMLVLGLCGALLAHRKKRHIVSGEKT